MLLLQDTLESDTSSNIDALGIPGIQTQVSQATIKVMEGLRGVPRVWNNEETVWKHTMETIDLVKEYAKIIRKHGGNITHIIDLLMVHDIPEIITGDMDPRFVIASLKFHLEEQAMKSLIQSEYDRNLWYEYSAGKTIDAQFAKALDKLQFLNNLIKRQDEKEYWGALVKYRVHFEKLPELLQIIDTPNFSAGSLDSQLAA